MLELSRLFPFQDVILIKLKEIRDARGFFIKTYDAHEIQKITGVALDFAQDNHSRSSKGVLRGIHYQLPPHAQGKLVHVMNGSVFDVAVDLRKTSPTFGKWSSCILRDIDPHLVWIPPGFGHGFLALEDNTDFFYKTTANYTPGSEAAVVWNDPSIGIQWPVGFIEDNLKLSEKDRLAPQLQHAKVFD